MLLLVGAVMARSGVWQDCQSLPTRTLHQWVDLTMASKDDHRHHSGRLSTLSTTTTFLSWSIHPHTGTVAWWFSTHKLLFGGGLTQIGGGICFGCHSRFYRVVSSMFSIRIPEVWCKFPSRTGWESVFFFPSVICVSFPRWLRCPGRTVVFPHVVNCVF